jgi:hypothetical protein
LAYVSSPYPQICYYVQTIKPISTFRQSQSEQSLGWRKPGLWICIILFIESSLFQNTQALLLSVKLLQLDSRNKAVTDISRWVFPSANASPSVYPKASKMSSWTSILGYLPPHSSRLSRLSGAPHSVSILGATKHEENRADLGL